MVGDSNGDDQSRDGTGNPPAAEPTVPPDVLEIGYVYDALAHPRRRYLCYTLLEDTEWTLDELATKLAAWEYNVPEDAVTDDQHDRIAVSLFHAHLPKLVADDIIEFDSEQGTITHGPNAEQVLNALEGIGASVDNNQEDHARGGME